MGSLFQDRACTCPELHVGLDSPTPQQPFRLLVLGGGYGGLSVALNLQDLCRGQAPRCGPAPEEGAPVVERPRFEVEIVIVDERDGFFHTIGAPLALASEDFASKFWIRYDEIPALRSPNIRVLHGSVKSVDPERKVATYLPYAGTEEKQLEYDFLVAATGLRRAWPAVPQSLRRKQYLFEMGDHLRSMTGRKKGVVVVVGGGAVGIELASELKTLHPHLHVILAHSRSQLLSNEPLPDEVKERALELCRDAGLEVLLNHRLERSEPVKGEAGKVTGAVEVVFTNGKTIVADRVVMAVSRSSPNTGFLPREAVDEEGFVKVQGSLRFSPSTIPNSTHHYAIGDIALWSGIKRCGAAMHMGYYAAHNIHQTMQQIVHGKQEEELLELKEIPPMIGLAVGKQAVAYWPENGMIYGEKVLKDFFGEDLGFTICWNHMRLGEEGK